MLGKHLETFALLFVVGTVALAGIAAATSSAARDAVGFERDP
jgi:hypothetical protein